MTITTTKNRDLRIDALKGFLTLCVIFGHMFHHFETYGDHWAISWTTYFIGSLSVYFFHMPLFFAVSQLFIPKFSVSFFKKTAVAILIPYFIWHFRVSIIYTPFADFRKIWNEMGNYLLGNWRSLGWHIWFLPALFSCKIIFTGWETLRIKTKNSTIFLGLSALVWLAVFIFAPQIGRAQCQGSVPFGIATALWLMPYFVLIRYLHQNSSRFSFKNLRFRTLEIPLLLVIFYVSTRTIGFFESDKDYCTIRAKIDFAQFSVPSHPLGLILFYVISSCIFLIFQKIRRVSILSYIGRYSFPIFLLHMVVLANSGMRVGNMKEWLPSLTQTLGPWFYLAYYIGTIAATVVLPILFSKFVMKLSKDFRYAGFVE